MSKKTFVVFGLLVLVLAAVIPWLAFRADGDSANAKPVASNLKAGQSLFVTNCGTCHTLYAAGTDGNFAPDLDELLAPSGPPAGANAQATIAGAEGRVPNAGEHGVDGSTTPGRMPAGIVNQQQAKEIAAFVATTAGE